MERIGFPIRFSRLLVAMIVAAAYGCMHSEVDPNPNFSVNQEEDIPAPRDFQFDKDSSYTYVPYRDPKGIGCFRTSELYYYGDQQVGKLVPWYLEQMKRDGWNHRDSLDNQDKRCLNFTKGSETATISIYREFDTRFDRYLTKVKAEIHPTRAEEMASEDLLNPPSQESRLEAGGKVEGIEEPAVHPEEMEEIRSSAEPEDGEIIQKTPGGETGSKTARSREVPRMDPKASGAGNKQVVNEEVGLENIEESAEESTPEDESDGE